VADHETNISPDLTKYFSSTSIVVLLNGLEVLVRFWILIMGLPFSPQCSGLNAKPLINFEIFFNSTKG